MSSKVVSHTPGPWMVAHSPQYGTPFVTNSTGKLSLTGSIGPKDIGEADANARLIAVAPELLAALRLCLEQVEASGIKLGSQDAIRIAQDAIAKAEGHS